MAKTNRKKSSLPDIFGVNDTDSKLLLAELHKQLLLNDAVWEDTLKALQEYPFETTGQRSYVFVMAGRMIEQNEAEHRVIAAEKDAIIKMCRDNQPQRGEGAAATVEKAGRKTKGREASIYR
jgi:hypothetical protein